MHVNIFNKNNDSILVSKRKKEDLRGLTSDFKFECFSFLFIVVLFSAGNAKKNVFTVFIVPIVTIGK